MRLLVTGGAGYIGSHCVAALLKAGHVVTVLDNLTTGFREAVPAEVDFVQEDIRNQSAVFDILKNRKIQGVVHFAAKLIVPESVEKPLDYYDNNVIGSLRLLQATLQAGVRSFLFSSTAAVYGQGLNRPLLETDPLAPINPYGASKRMIEQILADTSRAHPDFHSIALRYFNVAGASADGLNGQRTKAATHLLKVASQVATGQRTQLEIYGTDWATADGTCVRDYIHVEDLASAHVAAVQALAKGYPTSIFNCGYGRGASVKEVTQMFAKILGQPLPVVTAARRAGDAEFLVSNSHKIRTELGWTPQFDSLEKICQSALAWEQKCAR